jgi:hypothetical protein
VKCRSTFLDPAKTQNQRQTGLNHYFSLHWGQPKIIKFKFWKEQCKAHTKTGLKDFRQRNIQWPSENWTCLVPKWSKCPKVKWSSFQIPFEIWTIFSIFWNLFMLFILICSEIPSGFRMVNFKMADFAIWLPGRNCVQFITICTLE